MQGWRKRMEDSHIADISVGLNNQSHVFGVFDGHGGKEVAQYVKQHFTKQLVENKNYKAGVMKNALQENFLKMDEIMIESPGKLELRKYAKISKEEDEQQNQKDKNKQMDMFQKLFDVKQQEECDIAMMTGCTATVCLVDEGNKKLYFANAGDSRSLLCKNGVAYAMSNDHKPDLDSEKNRIYKADGWVSEGRVKGNLNLSRSLGDLEYKQNKKLGPEEQMITAYPEVSVDSYTSDCNFIVLACDGIWDCMTNQEVCDFVTDRLKKNPNVVLSKIIEEIFDTIIATDIYTGSLLF